MKVICPHCKATVAKSDGRRKIKQLEPVPPAQARVRVNEATTFRCGCGKTVIPLEGS